MIVRVLANTDRSCLKSQFWQVTPECFIPLYLFSIFVSSTFKTVASHFYASFLFRVVLIPVVCKCVCVYVRVRVCVASVIVKPSLLRLYVKTKTLCRSWLGFFFWSDSSYFLELFWFVAVVLFCFLSHTSTTVIVEHSGPISSFTWLWVVNGVLF